jgi:hypothetical protein
VATVIYHDNLNQSILEIGDLCNQMIPLAYDTVRTVRVIGDDDKHVLMEINNDLTPDGVNICEGKYDVVLDTGPSFATQRAEALEAMMTLLQTSPDLMQVIGDKVAEHMDWPGSTEIAARLKKIVPKELLSPEEAAEEAEAQPDQGPSPEEQQAQAMQEAQLAEAQAQLEHAEKMRLAELAEREAAVRKANADAEIAEANVRKAHADAETAEAKADAARAEARMAPVARAQELTHSEDTHNQQLQHAEDRHIQEGVQGAEAHMQTARHSEETHSQKADHAERAAADRPKTSQRKPGKGEE